MQTKLLLSPQFRCDGRTAPPFAKNAKGQGAGNFRDAYRPVLYQIEPGERKFWPSPQTAWVRPWLSMPISK
jgi:hypothetical protein